MNYFRISGETMEPKTPTHTTEEEARCTATDTTLYGLEVLVDHAKPNFLEALDLRKAKIRRRVAWSRLCNGNTASANEKFDDARQLLSDYLTALPEGATQYVAHPFDSENLSFLRFMIESHADVEELIEATRLAHLYLDAVITNGAGIDCISRPCQTLAQLYQRQGLLTESSFFQAAPKRIAILSALNHRQTKVNPLLPTDWIIGEDIPSRIRYGHAEVLALHCEAVSGPRLWIAFDNLCDLYARQGLLEHCRIYKQLAWNIICTGQHPGEANFKIEFCRPTKNA
jgi:hypothetical protein